MAEVKCQRYCRLCANKKNQLQLVSLVDNGQERFDVTHKIAAALHIQYSTQDNLPQEICQNCLPRLEMTFVFITACRKAQAKLIQLAHSGINFKDDIVSDPDKKGIHLQSRESAHMVFKPTLKTISRENEQRTLTVANSIRGPILKECQSEDEISSGMKVKTEISKPCNIEVDVDPWGTESCHTKDDCIKASSENVQPPQEFTPNNTAKPHHCSSCNKSFQTYSGYKFHAKSIHSVISPLLCELCGKPFRHQTNLNAHRKTHLSEDLKKLVQCMVCDKKFANKFLLKEHLNFHYDLKPFVCSICDKPFHSNHSLQRHSLTHEIVIFECAICGKKQSSRRTLVVHLRTHEEALKFRCRICDTRFESRGQLRTHGAKVHTQEEMGKRRKEHDKNVVKCPSCPKLFSKTTISAHIHSFHSAKAFPISCEFCGKGLSGRSSLAYHIKAIHSEQGGDWECKYCGEKFMTRTLCSRHEYKHTGDAPFKCPQCEKGFRSLSSLRQHRLVHAPPSPQHTCQICDKQFKRKAALDVHCRRHWGNLPFSCPDCDKTFAQKNDMIKHNRARHKTTVQNIVTRMEVKENQEHNEQRFGL